jgi:beta-glucosidase
MARAWVKGYQQDDLTKPDSVAVREALCGVRRGDCGARLQRDGHERDHAAAGLPGAVSRRGRGGRGYADELVQLDQRRSGYGESIYFDQVLRKEWGFDGFVVSDWGAVAELMNHSIGDGPTVARKALKRAWRWTWRGTSMATVIAEQVRSGKIPERGGRGGAAHAAGEVCAGLFDHPYTPEGPAYEATPERRAAARKVADETFVLLKNDPVEGVGHAAAADREGKEGGADWPAGRQPAGDAGCVGGARAIPKTR